MGDLVILATRMSAASRSWRASSATSTRPGAPCARPSSRADGSPTSPPPGPWLNRLAGVELELGNATTHVDRATRALGSEAGSLRRTAAELDEQLRRARLIPLDWAFQRLPHALRELERSTGRQADW